MAYKVLRALPAPWRVVACMSDDLRGLRALADYCRIESEFRDARGEIQRASPDTLRAVLSAMSVDGSSEDRARESLAELRRREWADILPPICVCNLAQGVPRVDITLPESEQSVRWSLQLESGEVRQGAAKLNGLGLLERRADGGAVMERRSLQLPRDLPPGYHRLTVNDESPGATLVISPGRCFIPDSIEEGRKLWGISVQLYTVRSRQNWGIGDFEDLEELVQLMRGCGGDVIGLNPLHALFLDRPGQASPYSPLSRLLLNPLYLDVTAVPEYVDSREAHHTVQGAAFQERLAQCRHSDKVDYQAVTLLKRIVLQELFRTFHDRATSARREAFRAFRESRPRSFELACVFQALREWLVTNDPAMADPARWPERFRNADADGIAGFRQEQADRIEEMLWLQWIADEQLARASDAASGMAIGLYRDLAVGADPAGAERWSSPALFAKANIGAPPDLFNPGGQDWGLPPPNPFEWRQQGYQSFVDLLRANMAHAGALRIDHAMALEHLYWIPAGARANEGAYVRYPMEDLIGLLALESHRNRCLIIGEDLGTVPEGFRERMSDAGVFSYRVLFFEREETGEFIPPEKYPAKSLAVAANHDLPTVRGWWEGVDIELNAKYGNEDDASVSRAKEARRKDREQLCRAVGLAADPPPDADTVALAVHAFLARSASALTLVQLDDLTRETHPVNLPSAGDQASNWTRRVSVNLDDLTSASLLPAVAAEVSAARQASAERAPREGVEPRSS